MTVIAGRHLVAVTACVSGVAHTYMAAERLERICQQEKWSVRIETQGALGIESELTEEDIQAAEAAARDYYAGTVFTVEGMEYLPQGSHPFAEGECNFTVTVRKDGAAQEDRLIQLDRTETGWAVVNEGY